MIDPDPGRLVGRHVTLEALCTCTQTYRRFAGGLGPYPTEPESLAALDDLARELMDPVIEHFGLARFELTYGFCSEDLRRQLVKKDPETGRPYGRIFPQVDQHMCFERRPNGNLYCARPGAACDFRIRDLDSRELVDWILERGLPFDSLYFYGPDRPIHLSYGPGHRRAIWTFGPRGNPTQKGIEDWVERAGRLLPGVGEDLPSQNPREGR